MTRKLPALMTTLLALVAAAPAGHADAGTTYWEILHAAPGQTASTTFHVDDPYAAHAGIQAMFFDENKTPFFAIWVRFVHHDDAVHVETTATGPIDQSLVTTGSAGGWQEWTFFANEGYLLVSVASDGPVGISGQNHAALLGETSGTSAYFFDQEDFEGTRASAYEQPVVPGVLAIGSLGAYANVATTKDLAIQNEFLGTFARGFVPQDLTVSGPSGSFACAGSPSARVGPAASCLWWDPSSNGTGTLGPGNYTLGLTGADVQVPPVEAGAYLIGADVVWP